MKFATTPQPPYYAVIFTSEMGEYDADYDRVAERMVELAATMPGFLGIETARGPDGLGITVSYWKDEAAIRHWRENAEHAEARRRGRSDWYAHFELRVAKVERAYGARRTESADERKHEVTT